METTTPDADLPIDLLEVENYRLFRRLRIDRFARVNRIMGKNGSGKSTLLEAIRLLATQGSLELEVCLEIARSRDQVGRGGPRRWMLSRS